MNKVSTGATKQSRNIAQPTRTIGLDLGDRNSWYCVLDEAGQIQREQRVRTTAKALREVFGAMPRSRVALETGTHSPWISRLLGECGHEVIVAHARKVRLIGESRKKDDRLDAQTLARLARIDPGLLCPVKHRSARAQADLTMIRARAGLVRARTSLVNSVRSLAKSYGERLRGCNVRNMNPEKAEALSPELRHALEPLLAAIEAVSERICEYNDRIEALAGASYPQVKLLVQLLPSRTWARRLTQSPQLGFGFCLFSSWNDFDFSPFLFLRSCRYHRSAVVQWFVHFSTHPQVMQQHRQFSCRGHDGSLLAALAATLRQLQAPAPEIAVHPEWSQNVLRSLY